jgi:hypothetical protein
MTCREIRETRAIRETRETRGGVVVPGWPTPIEDAISDPARSFPSRETAANSR